MRDYFDEFVREYPARYQERYGYWRPVIRSSIDKFIKCGDLKEGFVTSFRFVRCFDLRSYFNYSLLRGCAGTLSGLQGVALSLSK